MREFTFVHPNTLDEALAFLHAHTGKCRPCAGGTDLMIALRNDDPRVSDMEYLVDLGGLTSLSGVMRDGGAFHIGALSTHDSLAHNASLPAMLSAACQSVGAQQTRNVATIGGNVVNAAVAADTLSPLAALDATVVLCSVLGRRELPLTDFITGAGKTCIRSDELLTALTFPAIDGFSSAFVKLGRRKALAISRMNAAAALQIEDGLIVSARVSAGCVFARPRRVSSAENLLCGEKPSAALFEAAGEAASNEMVLITGVRWSTEYKKPALMAVVSSALLHASGLREG